MRFSKLMLFIALTAVLAGCGSSSSSDNQKISSIIRVENLTNYKPSSVEVHIPSKNFVFKSGINCSENNENCVINYEGIETEDVAHFVLKDDGQKLVAARTRNGVNAETSYLLFDHHTTGSYLLNNVYRKLYPADLYENQSTFEEDSMAVLSNSNAELNSYEKLSSLYFYGINDWGVELENFAKFIKSSIVSGVPIDASRYSHIDSSYKSKYKDPSAIGILCSTDFKNWTAVLKDVGGAVATVADISFPIGGTIISLYNDIFSLGCNKPDVNNWTQINDKLDQIKTELTTMAVTLGTLEDFTFRSGINDAYEKFNTVDIVTNGVIKNYNTLVGKTPNMSLLSWVRSVGGNGKDALAIAKSKDTGGSFKKILDAFVVGGGNSLLEQIEGLTGPNSTRLIGGLNALCKSPIAGNNLYKDRIDCNLAILQTQSKLISIQNKTLTISKDFFDLLEAFPDDAITFGYTANSTENLSALTAKFALQNKIFIDDFKTKLNQDASDNGLFVYYKGLPASLVQSSVSLNCYKYKYITIGDNIKKSEYIKMNIPNISNWSTDGVGNSWVQIKCDDGIGHNVQSIYYYMVNNKLDFTPYNVYGVLANQIWSPSSDKSGYENKASYYQFDFNRNDTSITGDGLPPLFFGTFTDIFDNSNRVNGFDADNPYTINSPRNTLFKQDTFVSCDDCDQTNMLRRYQLIKPTFNRQLPTYVRLYNDKSGLSSVFVIAYVNIEGGFPNYTVTEYMTLQCITPNCSVSDNGKKLSLNGKVVTFSPVKELNNLVIKDTYTGRGFAYLGGLTVSD